MKITSDNNPVTDEEKHAWCKKRTGLGAIFLTSSMYAAVEREGMDMRMYVIQKPMPEAKPDPYKPMHRPRT